MTTYVVIHVSNKPNPKGCKISQKRSTSREEMEQYKEKLRFHFPNDQMMVMSLEKAQINKQRYLAWYDKYEEENFNAGWKKITAEIKANGGNRTELSKYYGDSSTGVHNGSKVMARNSVWG
jgi:hypothetical protein